MNAAAGRQGTAAHGATAQDVGELGRARVYSLIASLLLAPPDEPLLRALRTSRSPDDDASASLAVVASPFEQAWQQLVQAACAIDVPAAADEYAQLFIAVGTPEVDPSASLYLSGFRNDAPLATLRAQLRDLGLARIGGVAETEDHFGALCEAMRLLIVGADGLAPHSLERQRAFFDAWIAPWYRACMHDLRSASAAVFYRRVAGFAEAFFELESEAFGLAAAPDGS